MRKRFTKPTKLSTLGALAIGALSSLLPGKAEAQTSLIEFHGGAANVIKMDKDVDSRARIDLFYGLPLGISGYSFNEFYDDEMIDSETGERLSGKSFGKDMLSRPIWKGFGPRLETVRVNKGPDSYALGLQWNASPAEESNLKYLNANVTPLWRTFEGGAVENDSGMNKMGAGIAGKYVLPLGDMLERLTSRDLPTVLKPFAQLNIEAFANLDLTDMERTAVSYGEIYTFIQVPGTPVYVGMQTDMLGQGNGEFLPKTRTGLMVKADINH